jgi:hypothetical protein
MIQQIKTLTITILPSKPIERVRGANLTTPTIQNSIHQIQILPNN